MRAYRTIVPCQTLGIVASRPNHRTDTDMRCPLLRWRGDNLLNLDYYDEWRKGNARYFFSRASSCGEVPKNRKQMLVVFPENNTSPSYKMKACGFTQSKKFDILVYKFFSFFLVWNIVLYTQSSTPPPLLLLQKDKNGQQDPPQKQFLHSSNSTHCYIPRHS